MKDTHNLVKRIESKTKDVETTQLENLMANICLPLGALVQICQGKPFSTKEMYDLNVLGYKRLIKIKEEHQGILPTRVRNMYIRVPCGIAKLCASGIREYVI